MSADTLRRGLLVVAWVLSSPAMLQSQATEGRALSDSTLRVVLGAPTPNPFQDSVVLRLELARGWSSDSLAATPAAGAADSVRVRVRIVDLLQEQIAWGRRVGGGAVRGRALDGIRLPVPGSVEIVWDGRSADGRALPSGPYFVLVTTDGARAVRKVLLAR